MAGRSAMFESIHAFASGFADKEQRPTNCVIAVAVVCAVLPLETSHLLFALVGAVIYSALQTVFSTQTKAKQEKLKRPTTTWTPPSGSQHHQGRERCLSDPHRRRQERERQERQERWDRQERLLERQESKAPSQAVQTKRVNAHGGLTLPAPDLRQPSVAPIAAPTFKSTNFDAEVSELLQQIQPTPECHQTVQKIKAAVRCALQPFLPGADLAGFVSGDLSRKKKAFAVAVPDVEIVLTANPQELMRALKTRLSQSATAALLADEKKLQKSTVRACTDLLVNAGFKFRRSAFRGEEPKVTLLAPANLIGDCTEAVPIDFSVNTWTPLRCAALYTEVGRREPCAKEFMLLVKRWARDRGICHAAKGHLSQYAWGLLTAYFLQVADSENGNSPLLPPITDFVAPAVSSETSHASTVEMMDKEDGMLLSGEKTSAEVGELFKGFMHFYHARFDFRNEMISVRKGKRGPPGSKMPSNVVVREDTGASEILPCIEDPFEPDQNVCAYVTAVGVVRMREEFARAHELCSSGASLTKLLEPWVPPEREEGDNQ